MKKVIFASIFLFYIFATTNTYADCYFNYPYNGQYVTYCYGDNYNSNDNNYYNYNNGYYNYNYNYNNSYNNNSYYKSSRTNEENYYNLLYMNGIGISSDNSSTNDDYFKGNVIGNDKEFDSLDAINIKSYSFKSATYNSKYSDAKRFITSIKEITKSRYLEGRIDYNQIYDIINDLDYLAENLNNQFTYYKKYETTGNIMYNNLSVESGTQVRTNYNKLKFTLKNL